MSFDETSEDTFFIRNGKAHGLDLPFLYGGNNNNWEVSDESARIALVPSSEIRTIFVQLSFLKIRNWRKYALDFLVGRYEIMNS